MSAGGFPLEDFPEGGSGEGSGRELASPGAETSRRLSDLWLADSGPGAGMELAGQWLYNSESGTGRRIADRGTGLEEEKAGEAKISYVK